MKILRDDQQTSVSELRELLKQYRRVVLQAPTGFGKTVVAADLVARVLERGKRVLITVPALSLVDQTVEAFYAHGIEDIGVIQRTHTMTDWSKPCQIASVQTLLRKETIPQADLVLVDECHMIFAKFYERLLLAVDRQNIPTVGLSATPWTRGLGKYYQALLQAASLGDLIKQGHLAPFKVFAPSHPDLKNVRTVAGDYHEGDLAECMGKQQLVADIVATWQAKGENRPTICFAVNRAHAQTLSERFTEAGVPATFMDCETPVEQRQAIRTRFLHGEIKVVCNCDVIGMGVDWPEISCVVYARPTRSEIRFVQNIGRALRTAEGKVDTLILDHSDTTLRLGLVTDIRHDELSKDKEKLTSKNVELPKECPECGFVKPPRMAKCPNCGHQVPAHARPVMVKSGELVEVDGKRAKPAAARFPDRAATLGQLAWYARSRGYKPGWASNKYKELYGVYPYGLGAVEQYEPTVDMLRWIRSTQIRWANSRHNRATDDRYVKAPDERFVPGTLCSAQDLEDFA